MAYDFEKMSDNLRSSERKLETQKAQKQAEIAKLEREISELDRKLEVVRATCQAIEPIRVKLAEQPKIP